MKNFAKSTIFAFLWTVVMFAKCAHAVLIDNGTVQLGVNPEGNLISGGVGLTFIPTGGEALAPGCPCEGWGIADLSTGEFGMAGENFGDANLSGANLIVSGTDSATTSVDVTDGALLVNIQQEFSPSVASNNIYQVDVTITNNGAADIGQLVYRRAMDWDVPPTEFNEYVTIQGWPATNLRASSGDTSINASGTILDYPEHDGWLELAAGGTYRLGKNIDLYGELDVGISIDDLAFNSFGDSNSVKGELGLRGWW